MVVINQVPVIKLACQLMRLNRFDYRLARSNLQLSFISSPLRTQPGLPLPVVHIPVV